MSKEDLVTIYVAVDDNLWSLISYKAGQDGVRDLRHLRCSGDLEPSQVNPLVQHLVRVVDMGEEFTRGLRQVQGVGSRYQPEDKKFCTYMLHNVSVHDLMVSSESATMEYHKTRSEDETSSVHDG